MARWALFLCLPAPKGCVGPSRLLRSVRASMLLQPWKVLAASRWLLGNRVKLPRAIGGAHCVHLIAAVDWFWTGFPNSIPASTHRIDTGLFCASCSLIKMWWECAGVGVSSVAFTWPGDSITLDHFFDLLLCEERGCSIVVYAAFAHSAVAAFSRRAACQ